MNAVCDHSVHPAERLRFLNTACRFGQTDVCSLRVQRRGCCCACVSSPFCFCSLCHWSPPIGRYLVSSTRSSNGNQQQHQQFEVDSGIGSAAGSPGSSQQHARIRGSPAAPVPKHAPLRTPSTPHPPGRRFAMHDSNPSLKTDHPA